MDGLSGGGLFVLVTTWLLAAAVGLSLLAARRKLHATRLALTDSRQELEQLLLAVPKIIWRTGPTGLPDLVNKRFSALTGANVDDPRAVDFTRFVHPEDLPAVQATWAQARATRQPFLVRFRLRHADGNYRWMSSTGRPSLSDSGEVRRWYGGIIDIDCEYAAVEALRQLNVTLQQRVEERSHDLARSEARYRRLFEVSNISFCEQDIGEAKALLDGLKSKGVTDFRGYVTAHPEFLDRCVNAVRTIEVNEALARLLGYGDRAELAAKPPRQNAENAMQVLTNQLEAAFHGWSNIEGRTILIGKDDRRVPVFYTVRLISETIQVSSHIDLTERERIEAQRMAAQSERAQSNRIATVDALSTSLAHELNQPIAAIMTDVGTGVRWLQADPPNTEGLLRVLRRLEVNGQRLADIVQRTRDQLVKGKRDIGPLDLIKLAFETQSLLEGDLAARGTTMTITCAPGLQPVAADRVELQQVLVNLVLNGMEAMVDLPRGDRSITVTAQSVGEGFIQVAVADKGPGIAEENLAKLFQPFFTTKPGGMGIGLQICRSAIEALGGTLRARNGEHGGAVFEFTLPVA
ncbi:PAS domain S-box-containing protein [Nitrospirillum amazonense]|uniref:histidine kinase n=1 Tax=Nitrospirillum amazonense TaxID=28077 RepID=A0A560J555_9PROT|nr:ATP-binding protein [Nitrospirillum amazonense]TWB65965.1 PAS domain S-box-containing protein [Nitrospirillum amazonense]